MKLPLRDLDETTARLAESCAHELSGSSIVITGGTGFVGRWLIETFLAWNDAQSLGARIFVLSRNPGAFASKAPHLVSHPALTMMEGSTKALDAPAHCDFVIHGATAPSEMLARHPRLFVETIDATDDALEYAVRSGAKRFLYLSSGAMYGPQPRELSHVAEDFHGSPEVLDSGSAYGETKRAGETLCALYAKHYGLITVIGRLFAFIGPHLPLDRNFAAGNFINDALHADRVEVRGDGTPLRSYLYAADLAVWLWVLLLRGSSGRAYNVGSEEAVSIRELAGEAASLPAKTLPLTIHGVADPARPPSRYVPSTARAREELGLTQTTDWRAALKKTYDWYTGSVR